ncbi:hypothetical protein K437DRAFT_243783 [Tilletiaria anomala UBC 951]|uniref:Uncharacterized protein n=1 Tax=Tilletiaria anomala (strain ATCC 24038 / CBS 436.72 / UBC 951) TaxID=1037660 RepID=A0A066WMV2_TILAU|nr:uncharacterized protein K437DRAFT_243783 [Tilletiaria anomala UBC 951]KDN52324.1 hypothetical protein K437DRAFT_243783 [Tilletiaria anomala UBC 951]
MLIPVTISAVFAALFAISTYLPFHKHHNLHFPKADLIKRTDLNLDSCARITAPGLKFCDDVVLHQPSGMAYVSCDPSRLWWDPVRGIWESVPASAPRELREPAEGSAEVAGIWSWDTRQEGSLPKKLKLAHLPRRGGFHPYGIAVVNADNQNLNASDPGSLLLLVSNQPEPARSSIVDVFVHDINDAAQGGRQNTELQHHLRLGPDHFTPDAKAQTPPVSPHRLTIFHEQYSPALPPQHNPSSRRKIVMPSFFFSATPDPSAFASKDGKSVKLGIDNYPDFAKHMLFPKRQPSPPRYLYFYIAKAAKSVPIAELSSWPGFVPQVHAWDGGGKRAGFNSSAAMLMSVNTGAEVSSLHQWDQHWVHGVEAGLEVEQDPYAEFKDRQESIPTEEESGIKPPERYIHNYRPQFVNFWTRPLKSPSFALAIDDWGRAWTAGTQETGLTDAWIAYLRHTLARGLPAHKGVGAASVRRPSTLIEQTTHVFRQGSVTAHPWEMERMKLVRDRGIFIPKEFIGTNIYRAHARPAADEWQPISLSSSSSRDGSSIQLGFLPTLPTGMAVDRVGKTLYVTGAYDERGIAKCSIPGNWAEL